MKVTINPGRAVGRIAAPPSKSYAHRLMIGAALAQGTSIVRGVSQSQDMLATLDCLSALGREYTLEGDTLTVTGGISDVTDSPVFPCRESGSTLRFFIPLSQVLGGKATFTGTKRLMERGVKVYEDLFKQKGISVHKTAEAMTFTGTLPPGDYTLPGNVSSQFVSGLLFALPLLPGDSRIHILPPVESRPYIRMTVEAMSRFGIRVVEEGEDTFLIPGGQSYHPAEVTVEGDWSNAAFLYALDHVGGEVTVTGLQTDSLQGDSVCVKWMEALKSPGVTVDLSDCPDLGPVLFAIAAAGHGGHFTGTARLRIKESDRATVMAEELSKFGVKVDVSDNDVYVRPGGLKKPDRPLSSHNDHRVVMAMAILASLTGGEILDAQAVNKSYPNFFDDLKSLGLTIRSVPEEIETPG